MAGGKAINIFKISLGDDPREVLNWRLWLAVISFGLMGAARGVDEGLITGTFESKAFQNLVGISDLDSQALANVKGNVSAMVQMGSILGAMIAFLICDRVGRVWATRQLCITWIVGIVIVMANGGSLGAVYAGRFVAGVGIGETVVVAPVYLAEVAPTSIRGLCTCTFTGAVYLGIMLAYFANWGCNLHVPDGYNRWAVPTSLHIMFAGIILILSFFQLESPRYLIRSSQHQKAIEVLACLRGLPVDHPHCQKELAAIEAAYREEMEATRGQGWVGLLKEMLLDRRHSYTLLLLIIAQLLACWSGGGAITLYAQDLFAMVGVSGQNEKLFATAVFGVVKLVAAMICALFLVDVIGRKRSLIIGIVLQTISMVYVAGFLTAVPIANDSEFTPTASQSRAGTGAIVAIYVSGIGWALGWNSAQYLLTAELFPLRIRAVCSSIVMTVHFAAQYGTSRALPNMILGVKHHGLTPQGTFWFFGAVTFVGGIWVWLCLPEAAGRSLETIERLFALPWYKIGLYGNKVAEEMDLAAAVASEEKERETTTFHREALPEEKA